jgi:UDP-N-acetylglucosamine--N-acetylmuramyl-(pentapeptide) pyrophosphoryl-undecaprenol N-acetylglucosamine transferase
MTAREDPAHRLRLIFAGGGTGGHLYPALAIAEVIRMRQPEAEITFIGTPAGLEAQVVPRHGYGFVSISVAGFKRALSWSTVVFFGRLFLAMMQSLRILRRVRPQVVVGTGGYVCGPPLYAASLMGIPTLLQEQNSLPGVTTRVLAARVSEVHVSFETTRHVLSRAAHVHLSGNPTRAGIGTHDRASAARELGIDPTRQTVLVFGGSQGAASINAAVLASLSDLVGLAVQLLWLTGPADYPRISETIRQRGMGSNAGVLVFSFVDGMDRLYAVADLAVCRAGATTIAELMRAGVPSILIPYPHAAADHQTENARAMAEAGAALLISDADASRRLFSVLRELVQEPAALKMMAERARALGSPDAATVLADAVLRLAGRYNG